MGAPIEQAQSEFALQRLDRDGEGGLNVVQTPSRAGEALLLRDRDEVLELPKLHDEESVMRGIDNRYAERSLDKITLRAHAAIHEHDSRAVASTVQPDTVRVPQTPHRRLLDRRRRLSPQHGLLGRPH